MTDDAWLTDHVLGEDDPAERAEAERRIAADPELRARVAALRAITGRLEDLPGAAWPELEAEPAAPAAPAPAATAPAPGTPAPRRRRSRRRPRVLAAAAVTTVAVFAAGIGAGALIWSPSGRSGGRAPVRQSIVLSPLSGASHARGVAAITRSGRIRLEVSGLPVTRAGRFYEAWLMTSRTRLIALASFRVSPTGRGDVSVTLPAAVSAYRYVDVSLQSTSDGARHSGDSVLRGYTAG